MTCNLSKFNDLMDVAVLVHGHCGTSCCSKCGILK